VYFACGHHRPRAVQRAPAKGLTSATSHVELRYFHGESELVCFRHSLTQVTVTLCPYRTSCRHTPLPLLCSQAQTLCVCERVRRESELDASAPLSHRSDRDSLPLSPNLQTHLVQCALIRKPHRSPASAHAVTCVDGHSAVRMGVSEKSGLTPADGVPKHRPGRFVQLAAGDPSQGQWCAMACVRAERRRRGRGG
jgi:hypothetical protein